jgi:phosphoribosylanthranilate isomerase
MITRVKICCIRSKVEARSAIEHGASAIGLVTEMPSGPGVIPREEIQEIASIVPPLVGSFLLTSATAPQAIVGQQRFCRTNTIQICRPIGIDAYAALRSELPGISLVQVVHVTGPKILDDVQELAPLVDAILLDSGDPHLPEPKLGGTGQTHDWSISRRIRDMIDIPVILAGGLTHENVAEAILAVKPFAVDVCTGVRNDGRLDEQLLAMFFESVRSVETWSPE